MPGFFSRIKQWIGLDNLTAQNLNAEFNNILTNLSAPNISGASNYPATLSGMQAMENPGGIGTEVLPITIQNEIRELRYMINQIVGTAANEWYAPVPNSLAGINNTLNGLNPTPNNRLVSGRVTAAGQGVFLSPAGSSNGNTVSLLATATPLNTFINNAPVEYTSDIMLMGLTKAPSTNNTCLIIDASQSGQQSSETLGERNTFIQINTIGSNISARNGTYCAFQTSTEVFFGQLSINNVTGATSFTNASPTVATYTAHPFITNDQVTFSGGSLPSGVTAGTIYYVTVIDANSFNISLTAGGSFINTSGSGSGTANVLKSNVIENCFRGWFFDHSDNPLARVGVNNGDTITLLEIAWIFATNAGGTPGLDVTYNRPSVSAITPATPAIGDYWLDLNVNQWKKYSGSSFTIIPAVALGVCATNTVDTIAARSFDFNELFSVLNTIEPVYQDSVTVVASKLSDKISVYGTGLRYDYDYLSWNTANNLDSGVSLAPSTSYYCYVTQVGEQFISDQAPHQRKYDLLGDYHPNKPWRCVGSFATDGSSNVLAGSIVYADYHQSVLPYGFVTGGDAESKSTIAQDTIIASNIKSDAGIVGTQLSPGANILGSQLDPSAGIVGSQIAADVALSGDTVTVGGNQVFTQTAGNPGAIAAGRVSSTGTALTGFGFNSVRNSTGNYTLTFNPAFSAIPAVCATVDENTNGTQGIYAHPTSGSSCTIIAVNSYSAAVNDVNFQFIAIGYR